MFIGNNIKRARELKGLTQDELAKRMGYKSRSTIARIENGDNDVSQSKLKKLADILDVSIDFLLDEVIKSYRFHTLEAYASPSSAEW